MTPLTLWLRNDFGYLALGALGLITASFSAYCAMNFTGASTYTSISGVRKEMRVAVPIEIGAVVLGIALWVTAAVVA